MKTNLPSFLPAAFGLFFMIAGSAVAFAQTERCPGGTPGWIADGRTGCRAWNFCPQIGETMTWSGACVGGLAQGRGTQRWQNPKAPKGQSFEGEMRAGKESGPGVLIDYDSEFRIDGDWRDGKLHGQVLMTATKGDRYQGEYRDGLANGPGVYSWANGDVYEGEFRDGMRDGSGKFKFKSGVYFGQWRHGRANGQGTASIGKHVYTGIWTNGCFRNNNDTATVGVTREECGFR